MSFAADSMQRALAWFTRWWQAHSPEVPAELAACEFECTARSCDEQMFETCDNRLRHAAAIRAAEAQAAQQTVSTSPDGSQPTDLEATRQQALAPAVAATDLPHAADEAADPAESRPLPERAKTEAAHPAE